MNRRKELKAQYKARKVVGGIYRIVNKENGRFLLDFTDDLQATQNWFTGCLSLNSCGHPRIREDWERCGREAFALEELDRMEKKEDQTLQEFQRDLKVLLELWEEKIPTNLRY